MEARQGAIRVFLERDADRQGSSAAHDDLSIEVSGTLPGRGFLSEPGTRCLPWPVRYIQRVS
jgi:hypothetical protein